MKRPWNRTPEFLLLQKKWYSKLKAEGFKDIEIPLDDGEFSTNLLNSGEHCFISQGEFLRSWSEDGERWHERMRQGYWDWKDTRPRHAEGCRMLGNGIDRRTVCRTLYFSARTLPQLIEEALGPDGSRGPK